MRHSGFFHTKIELIECLMTAPNQVVGSRIPLNNFLGARNLFQLCTLALSPLNSDKIDLGRIAVERFDLMRFVRQSERTARG